MANVQNQWAITILDAWFFAHGCNADVTINDDADLIVVRDLWRPAYSYTIPMQTIVDSYQTGPWWVHYALAHIDIQFRIDAMRLEVLRSIYSEN
jgi:hypothetical protein